MAMNQPITDQVLASIPFWELSADDASGPDHVAAPDGHSRSDVRVVASEGFIDPWPTLAWRWESASASPFDILFAIDGVRLYSPRVRDVIDARLGTADDVQWLPATVRTPAGDAHPYWVPHLVTHHDVLHDQASTWGPDRIPIRHVYSLTKLTGHAFTTYAIPGRAHTTYDGRHIVIGSRANSMTCVISQQIAAHLHDLGITGARLTPAPIA
ncbi:hypothetical protein [Cellulomonas phragmiteti]|uniref:Flavoprotein n=1 Tax=Cellulomonas phragmiteti TaxID=478780 RepID=A0ABQ4DRH2_9CELL|nr:hypothetical protein [Cellulomonas phragmiteti]GIG41945.1 hypothetical protein Cph01nite_37070 [Cellulomonas phragmiteti]